MGEDRVKDMRIENLIFKLNTLSETRKGLIDQLWAMEAETEKLRTELMGLLVTKTEKKHDR
jgi:hypothetical protein